MPSTVVFGNLSIYIAKFEHTWRASMFQCMNTSSREEILWPNIQHLEIPTRYGKYCLDIQYWQFTFVKNCVTLLKVWKKWSNSFSHPITCGGCIEHRKYLTKIVSSRLRELWIYKKKKANERQNEHYRKNQRMSERGRIWRNTKKYSFSACEPDVKQKCLLLLYHYTSHRFIYIYVLCAILFQMQEKKKEHLNWISRVFMYVCIYICVSTIFLFLRQYALEPMCIYSHCVRSIRWKTFCTYNLIYNDFYADHA